MKWGWVSKDCAAGVEWRSLIGPFEFCLFLIGPFEFGLFLIGCASMWGVNGRLASFDWNLCEGRTFFRILNRKVSFFRSSSFHHGRWPEAAWSRCWKFVGQGCPYRTHFRRSNSSKASVEMNNVSRLHRNFQLCLGTFLLKYRFPYFILTHLHAIIRTHGGI